MDRRIRSRARSSSRRCSRSAGRRAILRDRDAFPVFVDAVEPIDRLWSPGDRTRRAARSTPRRRIGWPTRCAGSSGGCCKELADLDNPMRTLLGDVNQATGGLLRTAPPEPGDGSVPRIRSGADEPEPTLPDLPSSSDVPVTGPSPTRRRRHDPTDGDRHRSCHRVAPDPDPGRSAQPIRRRRGVVLYNDRHADYLIVKDDESALLDYLATLVAKEYVALQQPASGHRRLRRGNGAHARACPLPSAQASLIRRIPPVAPTTPKSHSGGYRSVSV